MPILAIDLGGTRAKLGLVEGGRVLAHAIVDLGTAQGLEGLLPRLGLALEKICAEQGFKAAAAQGLAFGFPGLVDPQRQRVLATNKKFDDAVGLDLPAWARSRWGLPLRLENDARLALLGEWQCGAGRGCDDLVMLTLGTGVGSAVLMDGRLLTSRHFQAGSLGGHFVVDLNGPLCGCGNRGCVEAVASTWAVEAQRGPVPQGGAQGYERLFQDAQAGDAEAQALKAKSLEAWAAAIITLIHAYDPERVIVSGGVMQRAAEILPFLRQRVAERAWTPGRRVDVAVAEQPDLAALLGGAVLFQSPVGLEARP